MSSRLTLRRVKFSNPRTVGRSLKKPLTGDPTKIILIPKALLLIVYLHLPGRLVGLYKLNTHLLVRCPLPKKSRDVFRFDLWFGEFCEIKSQYSSAPSERAKKKQNHGHQEFIVAVHPRSRGRPQSLHGLKISDSDDVT